jgi:WD40 repeat protein
MLSGFQFAVFIDPITSENLILSFEKAKWIDNTYVGFSPYSEPMCSSGKAYRKKFNLSKWEVEEITRNSPKMLEFCLPNGTINTIKIQNNELRLYDDKTGTWETFLTILPDQIIHDFMKIGEKIYVLEGNATGEAEDVIKIYDIESKKVLKTFSGDVAQNKVNYSERLNKLAFLSENSICLIDLESLERECESEPLNTYGGMELEYFLPSGRLLFSYDSSPHVNYNIRKICIFTLEGDQIDCPTENLEILAPRIEYQKLSPNNNEMYEVNKTWSVIDAKASPDEKWLAICYGLDFPDGYIGMAFVNMNGQNFKTVDDMFFKGLFPPFCDQYRHVYSEFTWRPKP